jgi:hypothetical protein
MNKTVLAWMAGGVFILGALQCMFKGSVSLRSGHRIDRSKDPVGFWGVVVGLFFWWAYASSALASHRVSSGGDRLAQVLSVIM